MPFSAKFIRTQLNILKPLWKSCSLKTIRKGQNKIGELMEAKYRRQIMVKEHNFERFQAAWVLPKDERRQGVILYLHGGGYTCGGLEYALGFGSMLAVHNGIKVFCAAYRLAPEDPFPAAVEDALAAYSYLLDKGYAPEHICLCGESAGGGLCYSLCLKLRELGIPLPGCIVTVSPWMDLNISGESYARNAEADPSMTEDILNFFADSYTADRSDPLASPLLGDLTGMPPSLIFVGGDEILFSDSQRLDEKLRSSGGKSQLVVAPDKWHGYLLYGLEEDRKDLDTINRFLSRFLSKENKLRWLRLDNAAKIYPAARRADWSNVFRLSATLNEPVDTAVLQSALDVTARRFPSIAARLRKGVFWYYLQEMDNSLTVRQEYSYPLTKMSKEEVRKCALRVIAYENRIAVEIFHSLTDGNGGLIFLKSLVAEYLQQKHGIRIPAEEGVLGRLEEPSEAELEDSFQKYSGNICASRKENTAWHLSGTPERNGYLNVTCFRLSTAAVLEKAHTYGVSVTAYLTAVLMHALQNYQKEVVPERRHRKPIRVLIPVNLRRLFPSKSLRNFALYTTPEIFPRLGEYTLAEICKVVHHHMGAEINPKQMSMKIATNVGSERILAVKLMPLFIKNLVMKAVFDAVGEKKSCLSISNLGQVRLPEEMQPYVQRMDFILGVQATAPHNCGILSYGDTVYVNFIRDIRESSLESHFYRVLREEGISVHVQSNRRED